MTSAMLRIPACDACGAPVPIGVEECAGCGSPVFAASRRLVTVLFADLSGYTTIASSLDIEDVHRLVRPLMNALRRICTDLGGVVPAIEGDGFMAVFGARSTREDDPRRACLAAVHMQRAVEQRRADVGQTPPLRVALNTGEVLVAPSWERGGFSLSGDAVNVASRLCQMAPGGGVLAAKALVDLTAQLEWGPSQLLALRNRAEPVEARDLDWRTVDAGRLTLPESWPSVWVPRVPLEAALAAKVKDAALVLVGEAGVGKTRLAEHWVELQRSRVTLRARCLSFGRREDTGVAAQLARAVPREMYEELQSALSELDLRRLRRLRGEEVDSEETDDLLNQHEALVNAVALLCCSTPLTVLVDDLNWADNDELGLAASLAALSANDDLVVLLVSRPGGSVLGLPVLEVPPMSGQELITHIRNCLPGADAQLVDVLTTRSGGLPLYVEQCAQLLLDNGVVTNLDGRCVVADPGRLTQLPVAMRLFVSARLDLLPQELRDLITTSSVLGEAVDVDLLRYLTGLGADLEDRLEALVRRGFLRWTESEHASAKLVFRHQVVRDVSYESLLLTRRAQLHRAAAEWYSVLPVVQLLAQEAEHLEAIVALGEADCDVIRRTVVVLVSFARSIAEERTATAADALARAAALVEAHPGCQIDQLPLLLARAHVWVLTGEEGLGVVAAARAIELAAPTGDDEAIAEADLTHGLAAIRVDPEAARASLSRAEALFRSLDDGIGVARVRFALARAGTSLQDALGSFEGAFASAQRFGSPRLASLAAQEMATFGPARDIAEGLRWRATAEVLLRGDDIGGRARLQAAQIQVHLLRDDVRAAFPLAAELVETARRHRDVQLEALALLQAGEAAALTGRFEEAEEYDEAALVLAARRPTQHLRLNATFNKAVRLGMTSRVAEARGLLDWAEEVAPGIGHPGFLRDVHAGRARVLVNTGRFEEASDQARRAIAMDLDLNQPTYALRLRFIDVIARLATDRHVPLALVGQLRSDARQMGADALVGALGRWFALAEALRGFGDVAEEMQPAPDRDDAVALDLELRALRSGDPGLLLSAAETWRRMGTTVWEARDLAWHSELTGEEHPEADEIFARLQSPDGLAETFRAQVRQLQA